MNYARAKSAANFSSFKSTWLPWSVVILLLLLPLQRSWAQCTMCGKKLVKFGMSVQPNCTVVMTYGTETKTFTAGGVSKTFEGYFKVDMNAGAQPLTSGLVGQTQDVLVTAKLTQYPPSQEVQANGSVGCCGLSITPKSTLKLWHHAPPVAGGGGGGGNGGTPGDQGGWRDAYAYEGSGYPSSEEAQAALNAILAANPDTDSQRIVNAAVSDAGDGTYGYTATLQVYSQPTQGQDPTSTDPQPGDSPTPEPSPDQLEESVTLHIETPGVGSGGDEGGGGELGDGGMTPQPSPPPGSDEDPQKLPMSWVWDFGLDAAGGSVGTLALITDLTDTAPLDLSKFSTRATKAGGLTVGGLTGLSAEQTGFWIEPPLVDIAQIQANIAAISAQLANAAATYDSLIDQIAEAEQTGADTSALYDDFFQQWSDMILFQSQIDAFNSSITKTTAANATRLRMQVVRFSDSKVEVQRFPRVDGTLADSPSAIHRFELTTTAGLPAIRHTVIIGNSVKVDVVAGTADAGAAGGRTWRLEAVDGTIRVGTESPWTSNVQITDESFYLSAGTQLQQRTVTQRVNKPWGVEVVQESVYSSDAPGTEPVVTNYTYYEDATVAASYSKLKWVTCTDGTWQRYDYLPTGETRSYSPWKDGPASPDLATQANARCTQTSADGNTVTESIAGTVVSVTMSQSSLDVSHPNYPGTTGYTMTQTQRMLPGSGEVLTSTSYVNNTTGNTDWSMDESGNITSYEVGATIITTANGTFPVTRRVRSQELQMWTEGTPATPAPLREVEYTDANDRLLRKEILAPNGSVASTTDYTYDGSSTRQTQVVQDGRVTYAAQSSTDGSGNQVVTETDAQGGRTQTITSPSGEVLSQSKLAVDGTTVLLTTTTTKAGLTTTTTTTGGGLSRQSVVTVDARGRTVQQVDENGVTTHYEYQDNGRTVIVKDAAGSTLKTTRQYLDGHLKSIEGPAVVAEYHDYSVDADGQTTETVHYGTVDGAMYRKQVTNGLGQQVQDIEPPQDGGAAEKITQYTYDDHGRMILTQTTGMAPVQTLYDGLSRPAVQRVLMGANGTESANDPLITRIQSYATVDSVLWDVTTTRKSVDGDPAHDLVSVSKQQIGGGTQVQISQSPSGALLTQTTTVNPDTATVTTTLSSSQATRTATQIVVNGLLQSETSLTATTPTTYSYDGLERQLTVTTPDGVTHQTVYDDAAGAARSRVKEEKVIPAGGGAAITQKSYTYDSMGRVQSETQADGSVTTYTYNAQGRTLTQGGTAGYPLGYEYDSMGRLWKLHTYRGGGADDVTTWTYDAASGKQLSKTDAAGRSVGYTYDAAGRVLTRVWARGVTTTYSYDGAGRQTGIDYSDATPDVSIAYDRAGRRMGITDAAGTHSFGYDAASGGRLASWTVGGSGAWSGLSVGYGYTSGQCSSRTTSLGGITVPAVSYSYDSASGRMTSVSGSDFTATYRYNASTGWNDGVAYSSGLSSTRTADALGRLDAITWTSGGATVSGHDYTLDAVNRRTAAQRQDGSAWSYGYNSRGEVTSAAKGTEPGKQFAFTYDGIGNRASSSVSSVADSSVLRTTGYSANSLNQYESIIHPQPGWLVLRGSANTAAGVTVTIDGNAPTQTAGTLWFHEQSVDNSGGPNGIPVRREVTISATRPDGGLNNGPVTTQQKGALFIPPPNEVLTYDLDGNLTSDARWNYAWDGENRLIVAEEKSGFVVQPASISAVKRTRLEFSYDALGRRISKRTFIATSSEGFLLNKSLVELYDGWNMIAEIDTTSTAQLLRSYDWGTDISGTMAGAGGVGGLLIERFYTVPSRGIYAPMYDGNGSITELVNLADGSVSARYEYSAFGEIISMDGGSVAEVNPFRFSTKYLDSETELYNYTYRLYAPLNARWLSRDPIGERGGANLHGMLKNDSVNKVDQLGLVEWFLKVPDWGDVQKKMGGGSIQSRIAGAFVKYPAPPAKYWDGDDLALPDNKASKGERYDKLTLYLATGSRRKWQPQDRPQNTPRNHPLPTNLRDGNAGYPVITQMVTISIDKPSGKLSVTTEGGSVWSTPQQVNTSAASIGGALASTLRKEFESAHGDEFIRIPFIYVGYSSYDEDRPIVFAGGDQPKNRPGRTAGTSTTGPGYSDRAADIDGHPEVDAVPRVFDPNQPDDPFQASNPYENPTDDHVGANHKGQPLSFTLYLIKTCK